MTVQHSGSRRRSARFVGLALILSTPATMFITFALAALIVGEQRLEESGMGTGALLLPAALGVLVIVWAQLGLPLSSTPTVVAVVALFGALSLAVGAYGIVVTAGSGDPNIGSPILTVLGVVIIVIAVAIGVADRNRRARRADLPPPPDGAPLS